MSWVSFIQLTVMKCHLDPHVISMTVIKCHLDTHAILITVIKFHLNPSNSNYLVPTKIGTQANGRAAVTH